MFEKQDEIINKRIAKIELQLKINGENKTFVCAEFKGILFKKTLRAIKIFENFTTEITDEGIEELVDYMVEVFDNQFTKEEFYNGIEVSDMFKKMQETAEIIVDLAKSKI